MTAQMDDDDPEVVAGPHDPQPHPEDLGLTMETISDGGADPWAVLLVMLMIGAVVLAATWAFR